ncbi:hypothetical protein [Microbulbifer discodermiae]|uniref:hypothetical protein n=1 Tax=Microbulbifer sp. 2201CG32-9 TaxID=3232309 RepID=UPI00345B85B2
MSKSLFKKLFFWCFLLGFIGFALGQKGIIVSTFSLFLWSGGGILLGAILAMIFYMLEKRSNKN